MWRFFINFSLNSKIHMGLVIPKLYFVVPGVSEPERQIFATIQDAIDAAEHGTTITLTAGDFAGNGSDPIRLKSGLKFVGLNKAKIISPVVGEASDVVFEGIVFKNRHNYGLEFPNLKGLIFRNCEFLIDIRGAPSGGCHPSVVFGFRLSNSSAILENPIFCIDVEDVEIFVAIGADDDSTYLSLQSPIIRVQYKNVCKLETFFYRGIKKSSSIPYFEAFSSSIHYRTESCKKKVYDGHCCLKEKDRRRCNKRHCGRCEDSCDSRCKRSHECCDKKCKRKREIIANVRLFRGIDCVNSSLIGTKIYFIEGKGLFNIAAGDATVYVNSLTASTTSPDNWEMGSFNNLLLTSFMSDLKCACEIKECHCIESCCEKEECCELKIPCAPTFPPSCNQHCIQPCGQHCAQPCFSPFSSITTSMPIQPIPPTIAGCSSCQCGSDHCSHRRPQCWSNCNESSDRSDRSDKSDRSTDDSAYFY